MSQYRVIFAVFMFALGVTLSACSVPWPVEAAWDTEMCEEESTALLSYGSNGARAKGALVPLVGVPCREGAASVPAPPREYRGSAVLLITLISESGEVLARGGTYMEDYPLTSDYGVTLVPPFDFNINGI